MQLHGHNILGGATSAEGARTFQAVNPATGQALDPVFHEATESALELADAAFAEYRRKTPEQIAAFLETCADELLALGDDLIRRANAETALPEARLVGERARTMYQFKLMAGVVRDGSWVDARIDRAQPERKPQPKPDLRRMLVPLGPVAAFGAANFPLAYSVPGGDTASALAAGNPVVIKAHPAHPGTSELAMRAIQSAIAKCGMPPGVASMVHGTSNAVGMALVQHPLTRAAGFTGSLQGGRALADAAAGRPDPIPVFAEMGSTNPIFILPGALAERGAQIAEGLAQSATLGVGQFCTCPGLVFALAGSAFDAFAQKVGQFVAQVAPGTMLHPGIRARFVEGRERFRQIAGVSVAGESSTPADAAKTQAPATVFVTDARTFMANPPLQQELFGPSTLLVACESREVMERIARGLDGQLTATVHAAPEDAEQARSFADTLVHKAGRLIFCGFPTGVEVCPSMQHGGPYPASTDARFSSVGTAAILRFARPVSYQSFPQDLLPPELQNKNVRSIWRTVDGVWTKEEVAPIVVRLAPST
jgi:NADP-dependent aldehyde dehydrogenase